MDWPIIILIIICVVLLIKVISKVVKIVIGLVILALVGYFLMTNFGDSVLSFL
ncbi:MAG: hypothetical protein LRY71_03090 [Bacillaceae bacterium]|nr:hypothetical protein [Bacillaceae bacterium]